MMAGCFLLGKILLLFRVDERQSRRSRTATKKASVSMRGGSRHRFVGWSWSMADDDDDCVDFCLFWSHSAEYNDGVLGRLALRYLTIFNMAWTCCSRPCTRSPVKKVEIVQLAEVRQIWFINLRGNIVHEASCWRDARMRSNRFKYTYIVSCKVRLRHSCMKRLWCLYRGIESKHRRLTQTSRGLKNFSKSELRYLDNYNFDL